MIVSFEQDVHLKFNIPLLGHHQKTLDQKTLQDLRPNALEESQKTLVIDDVLHHLHKALEGLAISAWWGTRLQADLGDDQRLGSDCGQSLRHSTED